MEGELKLLADQVQWGWMCITLHGMYMTWYVTYTRYIPENTYFNKLCILSKYGKVRSSHISMVRDTDLGTQ